MNIGYKVIGNGEEKVFVTHGWKIDHTCFESMFPALDQQNFTYIFIDQRGYGLSREMGGPYTVNQVAEDIVSLSNSLKCEKFHIIGHSMGGKVIQRIMANEPDRVKSAVGITPIPAVPIPFNDTEWELFSTAHNDRQKRLQIFRLSTGNRYTDAWYDYVADRSMESCTNLAFSEYLNSWVNDDLVEDVIGIQTPILILVGAHDPHMTKDLMINTYGKWMKNVHVEEILDSGHYPMLETPLLLSAKCQEFIKEHC